MIRRFLKTAVPLAFAFFGLFVLHFFGGIRWAEVLVIVVAGPSFAFEELVDYRLLFQGSDSPDGQLAVSLLMLSTGFVVWASLLTAPFWIPTADKREARRNWKLVAWPLSAILLVASEVWMLRGLLY